MLQVENLHKTFHPDSPHEVHSLRGVDLQLRSGEFVTVIGSNGAGKSTLFNVIAGVTSPSRGRILIDGQDVTPWSEHRRAALIGRVFQDPLMGTADSMTIAENLTLALLRAKRLRLSTGVTHARRAYYHNVLAPLGLGLESRLDTRLRLLSGGQRQALTLLMATLASPRLLLLDEHTAALDPATADKVLDLTTEIIQHSSLTTMMITHNLRLALRYGSRTLMMDNGRIVLELNAEEKASMSVPALLDKFNQVRGERLLEDKMLL
jgi:putative ABC transport system ATP-binding protein